MHDTEALQAKFFWFSPGDMTDVRQFFAPGRVNLIGEHIDYNGGHVFPAALTRGVSLWVRPRADGVVRFFSVDFPETIEARVDELEFRPSDGYANYTKGVIKAVQEEAGTLFCGGDFFYMSNLANGAGLSSSAAVEVVTAAAVRALMAYPLDNARIAVLSQRAENDFVGVNCGIMDQFAVAMGKAGHAIFLDCQTLAYEWVPVTLGDYALVITNTNERRGLADSKYNERRSECEAALRRIQEILPDIQNLTQISIDRWDDVETHLASEPNLLRRARHVVFEEHRTNEAVRVLKAGRLAAFGQLMNDSHVSLRDDYEVTGPALDALAEAAWSFSGCLGSRMTGAGFGGCTVSLVRRAAIPEFEEHVRVAYADKTGLQPSFYVSEIGDGVHEQQKEGLEV
ncbi:galactokinase [Alicyclobacillus fastidiosus]|uniref:Galactokinase n=1 Tax=Alicyclobacillus fastidiosus TaxID=392011 RepID=A0ABV5AD89_9BACL|nr:galactokinase [Alicyclobacillus fastidiosus]WEH08734.1 galactokinase [Alicyclobacillus fastidiosus]